MALVEIEAGPHLVIAAVTRDAVEELGLAPGVPATAAVSDLGDDRALVRRAVAGFGLAALAIAACGDDDGGAGAKPRLSCPPRRR